MAERGGRCSSPACPAASAISLLDTVLNGPTVGGSMVWGRRTFRPPGSAGPAAEGEVAATIETASLEDVNADFRPHEAGRHRRPRRARFSRGMRTAD